MCCGAIRARTSCGARRSPRIWAPGALSTAASSACWRGSTSPPNGRALPGAPRRPPPRPLPASGGRENRSADALERSGPAARKLIAETALDAAQITPTGRGGRITKQDVVAALAHSAPSPGKEPPAEPRSAPPSREAREPAPPPVTAPPRPRPATGRETRVRMTRLRRRIAERLKEAQQNAAMLTTFNEIDMSGAIALRERWRETFEKKHGVRLGFMSIFVKAAIVALKELPSINAEIDGEDLVYKNHYDIGVAVGTEQGLVVPVVRDAYSKSFADIEKEIGGLGRKARDGKLTIEDLSGGTFTISNGGVYGSPLSTPILNPPQAPIPGLDKIK